MNRRYIISVTIVLAIISLAIWRGCSHGLEQVAPPKPSPDLESRHSAPQQIKEPTTPNEYEAVVKEKSIAFAKRNNAPIAFYGRVVDQDGKPLQGVAVDFSVTTIPTIPAVWGPDERKKGSRVTDQNGLFFVEGERGVSFGLTSLKKIGYRESGYYEQGHARYEPYGSERHIPSREKPVEFILIREDLPKAEELYNQRLRLNWNAGSTTTDFGPEIGKFEFTASRTGRDASNKMKKFEWEVKMRGLGFTLTKLQAANERIAPLTGYGSNARVGFLSDEKTWQSRLEENYAIRTDNGAYGLMNLSIYGDGDDGGMSGRVTIYLNKSGSRNIDHR